MMDMLVLFELSADMFRHNNSMKMAPVSATIRVYRSDISIDRDCTARLVVMVILAASVREQTFVAAKNPIAEILDSFQSPAAQPAAIEC
jgi:hypothetical protein